MSTRLRSVQSEEVEDTINTNTPIGQNDGGSQLHDTQLNEYKDRLHSLYLKVEECKGELSRYGEKSLTYGIEMGTILIQVKSSLPHGQFRFWVQKNCKFTYRTAQNYMSVTKAKRVSLLVDCEGLRESYIKIGILKPKKTQTPKDQNTDHGPQGKDESPQGKDESSTSDRSNDLKVPSLVEDKVEELEDLVFGHEDDHEVIPLLEPLVTLYNEYQTRRTKRRTVESETVMDLNKKDNTDERPIETDTRLLTE